MLTLFGISAPGLARAQFGFTVPATSCSPFSIDLAASFAVLEGLRLETGRQVCLDLFRCWLKIFSVGLAMGVVSGIVMSDGVRHQLVGFCRKGGTRARTDAGL